MVAIVVAIRLLELFSPHVAERAMVRAIVTADAFRQRELRRAPQRAAAPLGAFARELSLRTRARGREPARPRSLTPGIRVIVEKGVQKLGRLALVSGHQVAVAIEGDGDRGMALVGESALALTPAAIMNEA